ncbi:nucleotide sugar dehydrogenase [Colletotrichum sojae]|uniref:UDP-glucose 6-dehydrogenase n=1 Tax=Colletotrichum sojae TaxID=2175907 RepID=A0A8H6INY7_9PEZI|nr:nucleotide sugar dehydrogenase [Colletotrichum sojae]
MAESYVTFASVDDSDESALQAPSTVPTTPDGSCSFSPVLKYSHELGHGDESFDEDRFAGLGRDEGEDASCLDDTQGPVRNICCVGAGYVGENIIIREGCIKVNRNADNRLGGPTAAVIAFQNPHIRVTVVDRDERRIRRWNSRHPPIYEPGLRDIVRVARDGARKWKCASPSESPVKSRHSAASSDPSPATSECDSLCEEGLSSSVAVPAREPNLFFSTRVSECISEADVILIAVNTPTKTRGHGAGSATDMTAFEAVTAEVARHARPGAIVVEKSTVPCWTAHLVRETLGVHRPGVHFEILSNPEFLAAGTAVNDLLHPDRVLIGCDTTPSGKLAAEALASVYASWVPHARILTTNVWSSELAKLVANSMLAQRISSINSISAICERTGADVDEVAASIGSDPRIGDKFLKAGIGFGGSCFKKDVLSLVYLAESLDLNEVGEYWRQVVKMNEHQRERFARRVVRCLNGTLSGKKVVVLGYAFKKDTDDTREAPALEIIKSLVEEGPREVAVFDPCCNPFVIREEIRRLAGEVSVLKEDGGPVRVYGDVYEACEGAEAVLVATDFDEFRNGPERKSKGTGAGEGDGLTLRRRSGASTGPEEDFLERFVDEPGCAGDCPDCRAEAASSSGFVTGAGAGTEKKHRPKERVDWARVAEGMSLPRWVFDGRGVIDVAELEKLGVRVESVGRRGRS